MVITWEYDHLFIVVSDDNQSLKGYYLHRAHLACVGLSYIILRTSKPVSRLIKASCNPLSADEILSITVFISTRCSSQMAARPPTPSEHPIAHQTGPDSFVHSLQEPDTWSFRGQRDYLLASPDSESPSATTLQGHPLPERRSLEEAFRSPSSLEEDPPKMSSAEKGLDPNCEINTSVIFLRGKVIYLHY